MAKKPIKYAPRMHKISEEMKQWASLIATEISGWPSVTVKSMFGMTTFYRNRVIFGAVPSTRALGSPNSVMFKLSTPTPELNARLDADPRVQTGKPNHKWYPFEVASPKDLRDALTWFSEAYEAVQPLQQLRMNQKRKQSSRNKPR
ncbi:MAG: hypothetical protein JWN45_534 [Acidobacteriaceae bacterium]|nr:hypothetical protein [Acidobacteriaceae bacterium]